MDSRTATYQGRLLLDEVQNGFLDDYAERYNRIERKLYAAMRKTGSKAASFKNDYLVEFGITARQFNAIGRNLEGKITSVLKLLPPRKQELEIRISKAEKVMAKIRSPFTLHQKKRRLAILKTSLAQVKEQIMSGDP